MNQEATSMAPQSFNALTKYLLHLGDNNFIMTQRLSEYCGHGPYLEEDISLSNIVLDLLGQSRFIYQYAAELNNTDEDSLVYLRDERQYNNLLLVELPNKDYAQTILKLYLYSNYYKQLIIQLRKSTNPQVRSIFEKAGQEVMNHCDHSENWMKIFSNSTEESSRKLQNAIDFVAPYILEGFQQASYERELVEAGVIGDCRLIREKCLANIEEVFYHSKVEFPKLDEVYQQSGGKEGRHTEFMGYALAEIQHLSMRYPGAVW